MCVLTIFASFDSALSIQWCNACNAAEHLLSGLTTTERMSCVSIMLMLVLLVQCMAQLLCIESVQAAGLAPKPARLFM